MKAGANKTDLLDIAALAQDGQDAESISMKLQIYIDVVKRFMPGDDPEPAAPAPISAAPKPTPIAKPKAKAKVKPKSKPKVATG